MSIELPFFRYHPFPLRTGSIKQESFQCCNCGRQRDFAYTGPVYSPERLQGVLCLWCIADGSAAARFDALFCDPDPLIDSRVPESVVREVSERTPGYSGWNQETWLTCCADACEFHGDADQSELLGLSDNTKRQLCREWKLDLPLLTAVIQGYPFNCVSIFKFVCRHCRATHYALDYT